MYGATTALAISAYEISPFARHCMHASARKTIALVFVQFQIHGGRFAF